MPAGIIPARPAYLLRVLVSAKIAWLRLRDFCSFVVKRFLSIFFLQIFLLFVAYVTDKLFAVC
jgi:hypothetical protein